MKPATSLCFSRFSEGTRRCTTSSPTSETRQPAKTTRTPKTTVKTTVIATGLSPFVQPRRLLTYYPRRYQGARNSLFNELPRRVLLGNWVFRCEAFSETQSVTLLIFGSPIYRGNPMRSGPGERGLF